MKSRIAQRKQAQRDSRRRERETLKEEKRELRRLQIKLLQQLTGDKTP